MKVIDVAEFYSPQGGGVRTYIHQKLKAAAAAGHELVIVAPGPENREDHNEQGRVIWIESPPERLDPRYHRFTDEAVIHRVLDAERPDVVEGSSTWTGGAAVASWSGDAVKALILHQDPVAVYAHTFLDWALSPSRIDWLFGGFWRKLNALNRMFDTTVVSGQWLKARCESFGLERMHAEPFGIDMSQFGPERRSDARRAEMLKACGLHDPNAVLLVAVSRHHPEKRLGTVIDAVRELNEYRSIGLYLIGDGLIRWWVERQAAAAQSVHVAGMVRDRDMLATTLASADAMVHGGAAETFGLVIAEGLRSGLPLVVPNRGGAADLADPTYAETYTPGRAGACRDALQRLLARDLATARAAAATAGAQVRTPDAHFEGLFAHYASLCAAPDGRLAA